LNIGLPSFLILVYTFFSISQVAEEEVSVEAVQWEEVEEVPPWAEEGEGALSAGVEGDSSIIATTKDVSSPSDWHDMRSYGPLVEPVFYIIIQLFNIDKSRFR
jgi:hypothetical protein